MDKKMYFLVALFSCQALLLNAQYSIPASKRSCEHRIYGDSVPRYIRLCAFKTYPPYFDDRTNKVVLRNQKASFGRKFIRASGLVLVSEACEMGILLTSRSSFSKWDRSQLGNIKAHYTAAFTLPPIIDKDDWYTNYLSHTYQGAFDYNALRSQGGNVWQSALFVALHSTLWEYPIEGCQERPSIQDLIVTPIAGALVGELIHYATTQMSRNGFVWYEGIFVCLFNPAYVLNNGFNFAKPRHTAGYGL